MWILLEANLGLGLFRSLLHHPSGSIYTDVRYKSRTPSCFEPTLMPQGFLGRVLLKFFFCFPLLWHEMPPSKNQKVGALFFSSGFLFFFFLFFIFIFIVEGEFFTFAFLLNSNFWESGNFTMYLWLMGN